jgi:hypothetical protein
MSTARRGGTDNVILISGGAGDPELLAGTVDPSAGGGVAAQEGSLYLRYGAAAGQLWLKEGAAATAWTEVDPGAQVSREWLGEKWTQQNVGVSQTDVDLFALVSTSFDDIKAIRAGSIVGLGTRLTGAITDATADALIATVTVNGATGTLAISHNAGGNPSGGEATQAAGVDSFVAGDLLGVEITTLASYAPITLDLEAVMEVSFAIS